MAEVLEEKKASVKEKTPIADPPKQKNVVPQKAPDRISYRLIQENDRTIRTDTPQFPPYKRFPNTDIIVWHEPPYNGATR